MIITKFSRLAACFMFTVIASALAAPTARGVTLVAHWPLNDGIVGAEVTAADDIIDDPSHPATDATGQGAGDTWFNDPARGIVYSTIENTRLNAGQQGIQAGIGFGWSIWVKTTDTSTTLEFPNDDNAPNVVMGSRTGTYFKLQTSSLGSSGYATVGGFDVSDGSWHHMAVRGTGSAVSVYIDGAFIGQDTTLGTPPTTTPLEIGGASNFTEDLTGLLSDASVWQGTWSVAETRGLYTLGDTETLGANALGYNASEVNALYVLGATGNPGDTTTVDGLTWTYHTDLTPIADGDLLYSGGNYYFGYDFANSVVLAFEVPPLPAPEPSTALLAALGLVGVLRRRRPRQA